MNAKFLTLIFSVSVVLCSKFIVMPEWASSKGLGSKIVASRAQTQEFREISGLVQNLPPIDVQVEPIDEKLTTSVARWYASQKNYGLAISSILPKNAKMAEHASPISEFKQKDPLTGLDISKVVIKGNYYSLTDFKKFVQEELSVQKAIGIDELLMQEDTFEMTITIYGKTV